MRGSADSESMKFVNALSEKELARSNRVPGVRTVLVVLSSAGLVYDVESLRQKILLSYPEAAVFFLNTDGSPLGVSPSEHFDLLIDFTGPGQRQPFLLSKKLRRMSRVAVGRPAGWFRKRIYDRIFSEVPDKTAEQADLDALQRERQIQQGILNLAGVTFLPTGETAPDREREIPRELPSMQGL